MRSAAERGLNLNLAPTGSPETAAAAADAVLERRVRERLAGLQSLGLWRTLEEPAGTDFCSNDYLGFAVHPRIRERFATAARQLGAGSTGSRLLRGHRAAFGRVEERFAKLKGTAAALYFGSGWAANLGVLTTLLQKGDVVFSDQLNHASLIDGMRLSGARRVIFPHCDWRALARMLASEPCSGHRFVVTESLFSMDGDLAPLGRYAELARRHACSLIVDEAHAVGVYGAAGSGFIEESGCGGSVLLSVNSAGKALGVCGAFACGPQWAVQLLSQSARPFVFSTAPPPAVAEAVDESLNLLQESNQRRRRLRDYGAALRAALGQPSGDSPIVPVVLGDNRAAARAAQRLRQAGYDVRAIRPPTVPQGTARLRIALHADLDRSAFRRFARDLASILGEQAA